MSGKPTPVILRLDVNDVNSNGNDPHKFLESQLSFSVK